MPLPCCSHIPFDSIEAHARRVVTDIGKPHDSRLILILGLRRVAVIASVRKPQVVTDFMHLGRYGAAPSVCKERVGVCVFLG